MQWERDGESITRGEQLAVAFFFGVCFANLPKRTQIAVCKAVEKVIEKKAKQK